MTDSTVESMFPSIVGWEGYNEVLVVLMSETKRSRRPACSTMTRAVRRSDSGTPR